MNLMIVITYISVQDRAGKKKIFQTRKPGFNSKKPNHTSHA